MGCRAFSQSRETNSRLANSRCCIHGEQIVAKFKSLSVEANEPRSPWKTGIWLGNTEATDESEVGLSDGSEVTVHTIRRRAHPKRCDATLVANLTVVLWNLKGNVSVVFLQFLPPKGIRVFILQAVHLVLFRFGTQEGHEQSHVTGTTTGHEPTRLTEWTLVQDKKRC